MDAAATTTANDDKTPISALRRRNSIESPSSITLHTKHLYPSSSSPSTSFTTTTTTSSSSSSSSADYELVSLKPASYTSLRDILPSTATFVQSPKVPSYAAVHSGYEISIRNRLVKQAAWAYLQPMSTTPGAGGSTVFHLLWNRVSDAFLRLVTRICDCFIR